MISIGLQGTRGGVKPCLLLSLIIVGVLLGGCQVPPPDGKASASPKATVGRMNAGVQPAETSAVPEGAKAESVPVKTEDVPVDTAAVSPLPTVPEPVAAGAQPVAADDPSDQTEPVGAEDAANPGKPAADLPDKRPVVLPVTTRTKDVTSPASVVADLMRTSIVPSADAKIHVVDEVFDFGEITPLEKPTGTFYVKNNGTDTLHLTRVKVCCGAQHKLSSKTLKPGQTSDLTVTYVANTIGKFEKYLTVYSNDVNAPSVKLTIKGNVVRRLTWTPEQFKLFLDQENGGCVPVIISSIDGKPFSLTGFSATADCLVADVDPNRVAKEFVLQPRVDLKKLRSLKIPKGVVRIMHTHPGCDVIRLNYDLFKRCAFAPKRFLVLNADPKKTRIQRLTILDNYANSLSLKKDGKGSMLTIESVTCDKGAAVLKSTKQVVDGYQLTFEIKPPEPAGQRLFQDLITIELSTGDTLQVPVNGIYSMAVISPSQNKE